MVEGSGLEDSEDPVGKVQIDRDACMGSGNCLLYAPDVFDLDDDGVAVVRGDTEGHEDMVRLAAKNCPTTAIRLDGVLPA